jgi:hypothetical protein
MASIEAPLGKLRAPGSNRLRICTRQTDAHLRTHQMVNGNKQHIQNTKHAHEVCRVIHGEKRRSAGPALSLDRSRLFDIPPLLPECGTLSAKPMFVDLGHRNNTVPGLEGRGSSCRTQTTSKLSWRKNPFARSRFDDLVSHGVAHQFAYGVQLELAHDVRAMSFGRLYADTQRSGHFLTALAFRK